jgi:hypothetical protein
MLADLKYIIAPNTGSETRIDTKIAIHPVPKSASSINQTQRKASKLTKIIKEILRIILVIKKGKKYSCPSIVKSIFL